MNPPGASEKHPFPRSARVLARAEFDRAFQQGRRTVSPLFSLHHLDDAQPARLGMAVSRKVDPRAVGRNRIKRALRETFRRLRPRLASGAYVVVARSGAAQASNAALREGLSNLFARAGALPQAGAGGTMADLSCSAPRSDPASDPADGMSLPAR